MSDHNYCVMIPARMTSSRYPGKPLIDLHGKPMIQHVWERCCDAVGRERVYIATDEHKIADVVQGFGGKTVMTSSDCKTGTDRLAEANAQLKFDTVINVQGDEPLVDPRDIKAVLDAHLEEKVIVNAMLEIKDEGEFQSLTVPKVVTDLSNNLLYMSRSTIPLTKFGDFQRAYKQVCIYAFSSEHLQFFADNPEKSPLESIEDIEILRFVENGFNVKMLEVNTPTVAVDTPEDRYIVEKLLGDLNPR